jgi:hypothetical protein
MAPDEQIITQHTASPAGGASKALGVLAAVSAGGLMALRMKQAPLFFLAGAAVAALLSRKRVVPAAKPMQLMPQREPEPVPPKVVTAPSEIEAWLARQLERDQQTPVITLEVVEASPEPQITALEALKPEVVERVDLAPAATKGLFEVPAVPAAEPVVSWGSFLAEKPSEPDGGGFVVPAAEPEPQHTPEPLIFDGPVTASPRDEASSNASWLLDIEPLPSLDELTADAPSNEAPASPDQATFMALAPEFAPIFEAPDVPPMPATEIPAFIPALFQGAELPDEINVAEAPAAVVELDVETTEPEAELPAVESAMAGLFMPASAPSEPPTLSVEALEVPVSIAEPGEASFDDPLAFLEQNPSAVPGGIAPQPPLRPLAPMVEAEIIVRPRGLSVTKVEAKPAFEAAVEFGVVPIERDEEGMVTLDQPFELKTPPPPDSPPVEKPVVPQPELPPAPVVLPREQKARKTWRSWWRGD